MILFTNCDFLQMNSYDGDGRKTPKYIQKQRNKEKSPVWLPSHPPVYKIGGRLFSGAKEPETSRTPALGGTGILIYGGGKRK